MSRKIWAAAWKSMPPRPLRLRCPSRSTPAPQLKGEAHDPRPYSRDQAILRESLARSVGDQPDMTVVSAIADASEALGVALKERPDMILMDVCTEHDSNGIVAAARIKEQLPECRIIIMTGMPEITFVDQARGAGVDSFVYKNVGIDELFAVMRSTLAGYCTFPQVRPKAFFRVRRHSTMSSCRSCALPARAKAVARSRPSCL